MARVTTAADAHGGDAVEWQFDALDLRPVERWLAGLPMRGDRGSGLPPLIALARPPMRLHDRYLDTEDWRIRRADFVLRTRRRGRQDEATLRAVARAGPGRAARRPDITQSLPTDGSGGLGTTGPVGSRVHAVIGPRLIRQVLEVRTRRRPFSLRAGGEHVAELTLDDTIIAIGDGGRPVPLRRVRIRIPSSRLDAYGDIVGDLRSSCGLRNALLTKFDTGLLALGVPAPGPPELGPTAITPDSAFGDLAFAVIRRQLVALASREPGTRLGEDPEELHDMRVATRRLRAALELFEDVLPARAQVLRSELGWLAAVLGSVRDLDVQLGRMEEMERWADSWAGALGASAPGSAPPLESLRSLLERDRAARRREMLDALDSTRWERLWSGLAAMARQGPARRSLAARTPAVVAVPDLVNGSYRSVMRAARKAGRSGVAEDFHRLRIRCKRLRYTLEFTSELYGSRSVAFARRLARLQDKLGLMQDAEVATSALMTAATGREPLPPAAVFAMGGVAELYHNEAAELLSGMTARLRVLKRREWTELAKLMAQRRLEALAAVAAVRAPRRPSPGAPSGGDADLPDDPHSGAPAAAPAERAGWTQNGAGTGPAAAPVVEAGDGRGEMPAGTAGPEGGDRVGAGVGPGAETESDPPATGSDPPVRPVPDWPRSHPERVGPIGVRNGAADQAGTSP